MDSGLALRAPRNDSRQWYRADLILERLPRRERRVPTLEVFQRRTVRHQLPVTVGHDADRDVAVGERVAGEVAGLRQLFVDHDKSRRGGLLAGLDGGMIALLRRRADQAPKHR